jgi:uncharacterized oligopeptide transporter (OPT) family protein
MVEDKELPFPESVAASEIHKAGDQERAVQSIYSGLWDLVPLIQILKQIQFFAAVWEKFIYFAKQN